ncbi:MAG: hypothetical protein A4E58_01957 [Syntrophorhabdus sp. PtaB.Bin006]|nr:MAG: hypothetical protein A4E58_01957 [Syntrophorhabdus sp. PtaB.Bin006]
MTASLSMPTTFSPTTIGMPTRAAPAAKESQYFAAMKVDPKAPVIMGTLHFVFTSLPNSVSMFTLGKIQSSAEVESPVDKPVTP